MPFDARAFRNVLGCFATGVTIITTEGADGPTGITANSFSSVSLDPPLVLFCIDKGSTKFDLFMEADSFAINILAEQQKDLSNRFASFDGDRFEGVAFERWITGAPVLVGSVAAIDCRPEARHDAGDHTIFVGRVEEFRQMNDAAPLLYHGGRYASLAT